MPVNGGLSVEGTIHVDRYLTNFSVNYVQDAKEFVAQRAASVIPVLQQTDIYVVYDQGYFWRDEAAPRPLGGRPVQVGYKVGSQSYRCEEWALEHVIDDRMRLNTDDPIRLDQNATVLLTQKQMIRQDRLWAQNFFTTGKWSHEAAGVASSPDLSQGQFIQFNDAAANPIALIDQWKDTMFQATGFMPNTLVLGAAVKRALRLNTDITDRIKYTQIGIAEEDLLASVFGVSNVIVARSIYNNAVEGAANNFTFIANPKSMWLGYIDPNPGLDSPTAIALWSWTGLVPGSTNNLGGVIERGRDNRAHSDWFQDRMAYGMSQVSPDLAVYFSTVVA